MNQQFYALYAKVELVEDKCVIDLREVQAQKNVKGNDTFFISFKNGIVPSSVEGGTIEVYETHNDFVNYKICHTSDKVTISF